VKRKTKDRLVDWLLILLFLAVVSACAYYILRVMMKWKVKELG
jgi:hypothetical protein